ncbi:MAG: 30S ribosomal protein S2 [Candidatus Gastranaerophilales bacterium]|nr:30S ribosomal protein S2 [Candidatus Gastranaerophilales bacterium]
MPTATMVELLEAGAHFGHQTQRWNPKMKKYIYGERNGIYIINLEKTTGMLDKAYEIVKTYASKGKNVVFVGTKKQAVDVIKEEALRAGAFFINRRWLGGTLTNFETIRTRINKLRELEDLKEQGYFEKLPKKEAAALNKQLEKLQATLGGVKEMRGMPDLLFVIDQKKELIAIKEANKINIPVVCVVDTNSDPDGIDYVIPANDDAIRAIRLIASKMADAVLEGKQIKEAMGVDAILEKPEKKTKKEVKKIVETTEEIQETVVETESETVVIVEATETTVEEVTETQEV